VQQLQPTGAPQPAAHVGSALASAAQTESHWTLQQNESIAQMMLWQAASEQPTPA
jgi:hypothetical protein